MVGKNLSHYKILEELGRGVMGIVYRTEDTKLDRTVTIKVQLSTALASVDNRAVWMTKNNLGVFPMVSCGGYLAVFLPTASEFATKLVGLIS